MLSVLDSNIINTVDDLSQFLTRHWSYGRNLVVGWSLLRAGIKVLIAPRSRIFAVAVEDPQIVRGERLMSQEDLLRRARQLKVETISVTAGKPFGEGPDRISLSAVEAMMRRYSIIETEHRAAILFDITNFSLLPPLGQVAQLSWLDHAINVAQRLALDAKIHIELSRSTTGDGFYCWNRREGADADINCFAFAALTQCLIKYLTRNEEKTFAPIIKTCLSVGSHYSYFSVERLNPRGSNYIVGDVTIQLARMMGGSDPEQILIGEFARPTPGGDVLNPLEFAGMVNEKMRALTGRKIYGNRLNEVKFYLTGQRINQEYRVDRFNIHDKHGLKHVAYNAKINFHFEDGTSIYLGLPTVEARRNRSFDEIPKIPGADS